MTAIVAAVLENEVDPPLVVQVVGGDKFQVYPHFFNEDLIPLSRLCQRAKCMQTVALCFLFQELQSKPYNTGQPCLT